MTVKMARGHLLSSDEEARHEGRLIGEKKFNLDGPGGNKYYWCDLRKEPVYLSRRNFGGESLMVRGAFCNDVALDLSVPCRDLAGQEYCSSRQQQGLCEKAAFRELVTRFCAKTCKYCTDA
nr:Metridin ShK toxin domain containing protein [Haemonchus contortus]